MAFDAAGASSLEQFTLLAKNARGRACVALIQQVLTNKKLFVFRELLDMPNVEALQNTENHGYYELLKIFCFGNYGDYLGMWSCVCACGLAHLYGDGVLTCVWNADSAKRGTASVDSATDPKIAKAHSCVPRPPIQSKPHPVEKQWR